VSPALPSEGDFASDPGCFPVVLGRGWQRAAPPSRAHRAVLFASPVPGEGERGVGMQRGHVCLPRSHARKRKEFSEAKLPLSAGRLLEAAWGCR